MQTQVRHLPEAVNYHLNKNCNFRCKGCYAVFDDEPSVHSVMLRRQAMFEVVSAVASAPLPEGKSVRKLTFAGGEPTLCPWLPELIDHAKASGLVTMLVTNGTRCSDTYIERLAVSLDWLTLSIDSLEESTNQAIGRHDGKGRPLTMAAYSEILSKSAQAGLRTKINTVVNRHNVQENMSDFLLESGIARWKVLQVMAVSGQNDQHIADLAIARSCFDSYIRRHQSVAQAGIRVVPEPVESIRGSYAMIDPQGRFFDSTSGSHRYSRPILDSGLAAAFAEVSFDRGAFEERGGSYEYSGKVYGTRTSSDIHSLVL